MSEGNGSSQLRLFSLGFVLFVIGGTYQVLNALNRGWWAIDLERNYIAEGAIFDGYTINQVIAIQYGWLAGPLILITFVMLMLGLILILQEGKTKKR